VESGEHKSRSDGFGRYRLVLPPGLHVVSIRMLGYAALDDTVAVSDGQPATRNLYLVRVPRLLSTMVVQGKAVRVPSGFEDVYRRARMNHGTFVTAEQIDSINPRDVAALLNRMSPVRVNPNRNDPARLSTPRCSPMTPGAPSEAQSVVLLLNGAPLRNNLSINEVLDYMAPSNIQAVEMYNGPTNVPATFQPACAVVAIWTRAR